MFWEIFECWPVLTPSGLISFLQWPVLEDGTARRLHGNDWRSPADPFRLPLLDEHDRHGIMPATAF